MDGAGGRARVRVSCGDCKEAVIAVTGNPVVRGWRQFCFPDRKEI